MLKSEKALGMQKLLFLYWLGHKANAVYDVSS
jgi:hypothetical protein